MSHYAKMKKRVQKGAALLDEHEPDWAEKINPDDLMMSSTSFCILGQTFGAWSAGLRHLKINAEEHGFDLEYGDADDDWATLDALWLHEVKKRTNGGFFDRLLRRTT